MTHHITESSWLNGEIRKRDKKDVKKIQMFEKRYAENAEK